MIEVLFGEGEAGCMRAALAGGSAERLLSGEAGQDSHGAVCLHAGSSNPVLCLGFLLDVGDLRAGIDSAYRRKLIYSMYYQEQWGVDGPAKRELQKLGEIYTDAFERLLTLLESGESVRVWYSSHPYALCGLYHLCHVMESCSNELYTVKMPEWECVGKKMVKVYHGLGEVLPEEWEGFLQYQKKATKLERHLYSNWWKELVEENRPLRANINGKVLGVGEDFYDFFIWNRLTKTPVMQARLIGSILGAAPVGIGDWWYAARIERFIREGRIAVAKNSEKKYARLICLA